VTLPSGRVVEVPHCNVRFENWQGDRHPWADRNKPELDHQGEALYAELVILRRLLEEGWDGAWVSPFGGVKFFTGMPTDETGMPVDNAVRDLPDDKLALLRRISGTERFASGCWDVFAWRGEEVLFAEAKMRGRGYLNDNQRRWLEAALDEEVPLSSFLLVEWGFVR
jgi:hypothetical protein